MSEITSSLNALSARWAEAMWPVIWQTAALALVVLCLTSLLRRAPAAVRFWLWMLVPFRLLAMPLLSVSLPVLPARSEEPLPASSVAVAATPAPVAEVRTEAHALGAAAPMTAPAPSAHVAARTWPTAGALLMAAWLAGVGYCSVRLLRALRRLRRDVPGLAVLSGEGLAETVRETAQALGLRGSPKVLVTEAKGAPFVWGLVRPAVVLPAELVERMPREELRAVLTHEFAHLRRRDPLWGWLVTVCELVYFFHPAFQLAKRRLVLEREMACDDCVLALGRASCGLYAQTLVSAAEACCASGGGPLPVVTAAESFEQLKVRLVRVFADLKRTIRLSKGTVLLLAFLAAMSAPGIVLTARSAPAQGDDPLAEQVPEPTGETVTFGGVVTDTDGQPIPDAHVRCDLLYGKRRPVWQPGYAEGHTDGAGRFTLGPLPVFKKEDANYFLICQHSRYAIGKFGSWWPGRADPGDIHIKLAPSAVVSGRVIEEHAKGVPGATVEAALQLFEKGQGPYDYFDLNSYNGLAVQTDAEGRFEFRHLPHEARVHLLVRAEGYALYSTRLGHEGGTYPIRAGETEVVAVLQPGGTIEGQLTLGGKPYREAGIPILAEGPMRAEAAFTSPEGRFVVSGLPPGTYSVAARPDSLPEPGIACVPAVGIEVARGATVKSVEIALFKGPMVSGIVRSGRTGDPAPDAYVCAFKGESVVSRSKTGADGRYHLPLPPGEFEIGVQVWRQDRFVWVKKPVRVREASSVGDVDFSVRVREKVHGRLVDKAGRPLRGSVKLGDTVETADDGTFSIPEPSGMPEDVEVGLAFDKDKKLGRGFLWQHSDLGKELKLVLEPLTTLAGRFEDEVGFPIAGVEANLHIHLQGSFSVSFPPPNSPWRTVVEQDGSFTVSGVPVGLRVQVYGEKRGFVCPAREYVERAAGETVELGAVRMRRQLPGRPAPGIDTDAAVEWNAEISGRILNEEGKPVRGAQVWADVGPGARPEDNTDRGGRFRLQGLPTGRLIRVSAHYPGYGHTSFRDVRTGQQDLELFIFPQGYEWYGKPAPPLVVQKWFNSEPISLDNLRGKVVLLQIGIHIGHYSAFADQMRAALAKYGDKGLAVIAVHQDLIVGWPGTVTEEQVAAYLTAQKITWPVALDAPSSKVPADVPRDRVVGNGATYSVYDVKATPALYLVDKKGILRCSPTDKNLNEWIERLLTE